MNKLKIHPSDLKRFEKAAASIRKNAAVNFLAPDLSPSMFGVVVSSDKAWIIGTPRVGVFVLANETRRSALKCLGIWKTIRAATVFIDGNIARYASMHVYKRDLRNGSCRLIFVRVRGGAR